MAGELRFALRRVVNNHNTTISRLVRGWHPPKSSSNNGDKENAFLSIIPSRSVVNVVMVAQHGHLVLVVAPTATIQEQQHQIVIAIMNNTYTLILLSCSVNQTRSEYAVITPTKHH